MSKASACRRSRRSVQPNLAWAAFLEFNTGYSVDSADAPRAGRVKRFDWWLDAIHDSSSRHGAAPSDQVDEASHIEALGYSLQIVNLSACA